MKESNAKASISDSATSGWIRLLKVTVGLAVVGFLGGVGCQPTQSPPALKSDSSPASAAQCPVAYDPAQDYFPKKVQPDYAVGFSVEYHRHYKIVTVQHPWKGANQTFQYLLVQCGTPKPPGFEDLPMVEVPISSLVVLSTTYLPHLELLGQLDTLVGVSQFKQVNSLKVRAKIDRGELVEFNSGNTLDVERLLVTAPDLVMTYGTGNPDTDNHPRLVKAGLPVALVGEYMEESPLGQAEWLKYTALFFNQEAQAEQVFSGIAQEYQSMVQLTQSVAQRPTVFTGFSHNGTWYMPGGKSYVSQLLQDAGANYLWSESDAKGSLPLDFEAVFNRAVKAEFWVNVSQDWRSRQDAIAADARYGQLAAVQADRVFNNTARVNAAGGNDYWESGVVNPHKVLADLIKIFHPELLPDHQLIYYQKLDS